MIKRLTNTNNILFIIALCAMLFCGLFAINNIASKKWSATAYEAGSSATLTAYNPNVGTSSWQNLIDYNVENLIITNNFDPSNATGAAVDVSLAKDGSLHAYKIDNGDGTYNCVIYANVEKIYAPSNCESLFAGNKLSNVKSITFENNCFDTSNATTMRDMFSGCSSLTSLDLSGFNTEKVTSMLTMFSNCSSLTSLDLSSFDTSQVTDMHGVFYFCYKLDNLDVSHFKTSNVTDMSSMFYNCKSLKSVNIKNWDVSKVKDLSYMFCGCWSFTGELDFSNWNTSSLTNASYMFQSCVNITSLNLSGWDTSKIESITNMHMFFAAPDGESQKGNPTEFFLCLLAGLEYDNTMTFKKLYCKAMGISSTTMSEEECKQALETELGGSSDSIDYGADAKYQIRTLNLSNWTIPYDQSYGMSVDELVYLETFYLPKEINDEIVLPSNRTFVEQGTSTVCTKATSEHNGKVLVAQHKDETTLNSFWFKYLDYHITNLTITNDNSKVPATYVQYFETSETYDGNLFVYVVDNDNETYDCIIYSSASTIYLPEKSSYIFKGEDTKLDTLKTVTFDTIDTSLVTNYNGMFYGCSNLKTLDISEFEVDSTATSENFLHNANKIEKIIAPNACDAEIVLPKPMKESATNAIHKSLSTATNGKTLVIIPVLDSSWKNYVSQYNIINLTVTTNSSSVPSGAVKVDISSSQDNSIIAYLTNLGNDSYGCVIYGKTIYLPDNCEELLGLSTLEKVKIEGVDTSIVTSLNNMFASLGHDITIKGYCSIISMMEDVENFYVEGMTFLDLVGEEEASTNQEAETMLEEITGLDWAESGSYDLTIESAIVMLNLMAGTSVAYTDGMTFKEFYYLIDGTEYDGTEEQCKATIEQMLGCTIAYSPLDTTNETIKILNISNMTINSAVTTTEMLTGLTNLQVLYAPNQCEAEIILPATMYKEGTSIEYSSLSDSTNGLVLLNSANSTNTDTEPTPDTGFVDEQLLPMLCVGLLSILIVAYVATQKNKREI